MARRADRAEQQKFYRLFRVPAAGHCVVPNAFPALVNWVENGVAPQQIINQTGTRTRPLCPYPQTAIYNGSGDTNVAANFHCGGNLETRAVVCADVLTKYKHEANGHLDLRGTGLHRNDCSPRGHDDDDDDDRGDGRD